MTEEPDAAPLAVVTGGGTGIGRAVAELLAGSGYQVIALGLDRDGDLPGVAGQAVGAAACQRWRAACSISMAWRVRSASTSLLVMPASSSSSGLPSGSGSDR